MSNRFVRVATPGGDDGVWDEYEEPINLLGLGNNTLKLYNDAGTLKLAQGRCGLDDSSSKGACIVDTITTITIAVLTASLWAKVELSKTASALNIEITSIAGENDPETLPASFTGGYDADKQGFYISATKRCIGLVWINAGSAIEGIVNCLAGESYCGYATSDDADDYIYTYVLINGDSPNYAKLGEANTFQQDQTFEGDNTFTGDNTFSGNLDLSGASLTPQIIDSAVLAINQTQTLPHGVGAVPSLHHVTMLCVTADAGYSPGDEVEIPGYTGTGSALYQVDKDATNFQTKIYNATMYLMNKANQTQGAITPGNWKFRIRYIA
jgi:hypothetical protein